MCTSSLSRAWGASVVLAVLLLAASPGIAIGQLITNGSFEVAGPGADGGVGRQVYVSGTHTNDITGWTLQGVGDVYLHITPAIGSAIGANFNFAQAGSQYLDLSGGIGGGSAGNHATLFQDFATTPGALYELRFFTGAAFAPAATINVRVDGTLNLLNQTLTAAAPATNIVWTQELFQFNADSATTRLSFRDVSGNDDNVSFVDNVSISAVPEPGALLLGMMMLGVGGYCFGRRRANPVNPDSVPEESA